MILETNNVVVFDLDDTLYKEIDFLKSAFHDISEIIATNSRKPIFGWCELLLGSGAK